MQCNAVQDLLFKEGHMNTKNPEQSPFSESFQRTKVGVGPGPELL